MVSPKKENGYTAIANEIMEALIKYSLPSSEMRCLLFVIRKTYGFNKKTDAISLSQFVRATSLNRRAVIRALNNLNQKNLIYKERGGVKNDTILTSKYRFNKHYNSWNSSVKIVTGRVKRGKKVVSKLSHTKDTIQKKEIYSRVINYLNTKTGKKYKATTDKTISLINARLNDGFTPEDFKKVIDVKTSQWLKDAKNNQYLRPETLFGNKFEGYLNDHGGKTEKIDKFKKAF